ncbi:galactose mutarotase [Opitutales bacterium]|nr:galactose mutarotase [Opitutales bacterium]
MKIIFNQSIFISIVIFLSFGCTVSEITQKTKDGFVKSKSYLTEKSKFAYEKGREQLGLSENTKSQNKAMTVAKKTFGEMPNGEKVSLFVLTNANKMQVSLLDYGATVKEIVVPNRDGKLENVSLGFSNLKDYREKSPYFGSTAGRYANRIAKGKFSLNGKEYQLAVNNGVNHLHGGERGFDKIVWNAKIKDVGTGVVFTMRSPDGDEGYPGNLVSKVTYTLTNENELKIEYSATCDKETVLNLTNHTYFNLAGEGDSTILDHQLTLFADKFVATDETNIPTSISKVSGTPLDFTKPFVIGERIEQEHEQLQFGKGYDHTWVIRNEGGTEDNLRHAATLRDPGSGRKMEIYTDQPGIQFYSGNYLDGSYLGHSGKPYPFRSGLCLETQVFPDSPNHQGEKGWKSCVLKPGDTYRHTTLHKFSVE